MTPTTARVEHLDAPNPDPDHEQDVDLYVPAALEEAA